MNLVKREIQIPTTGYLKSISDQPTSPKILYIIGQLRRGGAEQQLYYLIKHLKPRAKVVSLSQGGYWADPIRNLSIDVIELARKRSFDLVRLRELTKIIREYEPDIIHIFLDNVPGMYGRLAALLSGHFNVVTGERAEPALQQPFWYRLLKRVMNRMVAAVVSNSKATYEYLLSRKMVEPRKLSCIPNGLELELFARKTSSPRGGQDRSNGGRSLRVGTVGSLVPVKAPDVFIRAAACVLMKYPNATFVYVGDGPLRPRMETLTRDLGIHDRFRFAGECLDVSQQLLGMDLFVLTSNSEGFPNSVMEAMAAGLPCVVTDAGGCREVVCDGETGFVVPVRDEAKLAERIVLLLGDEELRRSMGRKGQEYVLRFDVRCMAEQYRLLYAQIMETQVN